MAELTTTITCPACGHAAIETMPTDACLWSYTCLGCDAQLTPRPGDCCVFCSYGDRRCPPVQDEGTCHFTPIGRPARPDTEPPV